MTHQVTPSRFGDVLVDGSAEGGTGCTGDCDAFKGIAFRYLAELYALDHTKTRYREVLDASARAIWEAARNPDLGLFGVAWTGPPPASASLGAEASAVMALGVFAARARVP